MSLQRSWRTTIKKAMDSPEVKARMVELGLYQQYMGPDEYATYWNQVEVQTKPVMEELLKEQGTK